MKLSFIPGNEKETKCDNKGQDLAPPHTRINRLTDMQTITHLSTDPRSMILNQDGLCPPRDT